MILNQVLGSTAHCMTHSSQINEKTEYVHFVHVTIWTPSPGRRKNGQCKLWLTCCLDCFISPSLFQNKLQQTALASFLPSCENFKISCLLGSTEALGCFQFHFYGIWFLSVSNMSPFTVHPINSWQVYKLLFKQCQPLVLPITNIIQIELYFFKSTPPIHTWK